MSRRDEVKKPISPGKSSQRHSGVFAGAGLGEEACDLGDVILQN